MREMDAARDDERERMRQMNENAPSMPGATHTMGISREATAREMLLERYNRLLLEAEDIRKLLDAMPAELSAKANRALCHIILRSGR